MEMTWKTPTAEELRQIATAIRRDVLRLSFEARASHIGSAFSIIEILTALYFAFMNTDPERPLSDERDRFILSKGHACTALYATLARRGYFDKNILEKFGVDGGTLEHHPTRNVHLGIEASTGSLGHGLSIGSGMALASKRSGPPHRVFVLQSDGEMNEGSVWEAALFSAHHRLDNLVAIVDCNGMQALGATREVINTDPVVEKWRAFGWGVREVNGHDIPQILGALGGVPFEPGRPNVIVARTVKGKGVSFMENELLWHYRIPDEEEYRRALAELENR